MGDHHVMKTSSNGIWEGDNPLDYAFPLLIVQTTLVLVLSRFLAFLLKPFRQPHVIAEILGGILLGPSVFGRNRAYLHRIFPKWSTPILESVASIGLLFFLFLVGLELDMPSIRRSGRRACAIAAAGISFPFILGVGIAFLLRKTVDGVDKVGYPQFLVFMGVSLSITAFPVLARILAELKLLTTRVGETAMAAAAFNDVAAWILLALAIAIAENGGAGPQKSPLISVWVLCSGLLFVAFMIFVIRPAMNWISRRFSPENEKNHGPLICLTLAGVMVAGFITDLIGIHSIFGAFVFGLMIPKGGTFAGKLIERIEDFVSGMLLPLYFASSGLKTDIAKISGVEDWGLLVLVIATASAGKIVGTFAVAMMCRIPVRESLTLGVLMNTKGLVELIVLNIGREKKVLNDEVFAILILMALFTTFMTTPLVMAIYKPVGVVRTISRLKMKSVAKIVNDDIRILVCVYGPRDIPSLSKLIKSTWLTTTESRLKLYVLRLTALTERSSSIAMVPLVRRNGFPCIGRMWQDGLLDQVKDNFSAHRQVIVRTGTALSALTTMHKDICHVAGYKTVSMIVLLFHKKWRKTDGDDVVEDLGHEWRDVNRMVLDEATCPVALLVDRGFGRGRQEEDGPTGDVAKHVCLLFFGGPDDREALEFSGKMVAHPTVTMTIIRFVEEAKTVMFSPSPNKCGGKIIVNMGKEELDERALAEFRQRWGEVVEYIEKTTNNVIDEILDIGRSGKYDLIIVGRGRCSSTTVVAELGVRQVENVELGPIGDIMASTTQGIVSSLLVVQQPIT